QRVAVADGGGGAGARRVARERTGHEGADRAPREPGGDAVFGEMRALEVVRPEPGEGERVSAGRYRERGVRTGWRAAALEHEHEGGRARQGNERKPRAEDPAPGPGAQEAEPDPRPEGQARVDHGDVGSQRRPASQTHLGARPVLTRFARSVSTPARLRRAPQTPSASSTALAVGLPPSIDLGA